MSKRAAPVKGQGNVYLRPGSPYWQISYWNGWHQERESTHTTDYAEAVKTLQRKLGEVAVGKSAGAPADLPLSAEPCSPSRVRFAAPQSGAPLTAPRRSAHQIMRRAAPAGTRFRAGSDPTDLYTK